MDPLLLIIKYLFKKKNISNNDDNIQTFFKNGVSFPQLIALIFDVESIPGIKKNPKLVFHQKINNDTALQYLFFKNEKIKNIGPSYETEKNQINLLQLIFTMQCFTTPAEALIDQTNKILEKSGITITKKSELISLKILSTLLNSFTKGTFPISQNYDEIINNFNKYDIPLVFNEKCLDVQDSYIFLIQIQILFEHFEDNQNKVQQSDQKNTQNQPKDQKEQQTTSSKVTPKLDSTSAKYHINIQDQPKPKQSEIIIPPPKSEIKIPTFSNVQSKPEPEIQPKTNLQPKSEILENKNQGQPKEIPKPNIEPQKLDKPPEPKPNSILDRIKFYNQNASNNDAKRNEPLPPTKKSNDTPPISRPSISPQISDNNNQNQQDGQILESREDQLLRERENLMMMQRSNQPTQQYTNDRKMDTEIQNQYSDEEEKELEIGTEEIIQNQYSDDNEQSQESDELSEDPEQIEKEFEQFQKLMSDISDDLEEEEEKIEEIKKDDQETNKKEEDQKAETKDKEEEEEEEEEEEIEHIGSFIELSKNWSKLNASFKNLFENLKNYIKIDTVYQRLHVDQSSSYDKLWNIQIDNYKYDNGILLSQNASTSKKEKNKDKEPSVDTSNSDPKKPKTDIYKMMRYDEQKYCWNFCENDLNKFIHRPEDNPTIPLILFIDSKMDDISNLSSVLRKNDLENSSEEEISVLSFWRESVDMWEYNKEIEFPNTITELLFLYVYIPKSKEKHKNIGTILYQIYTFLFMICDLSIVLLNDQYQNMQILFIKELIDIGKLILKDQEITNIYDQIFYDKSNVLFLKVDEKDKSTELESIIKPNITVEYKISFIKNVKEFLIYLDNLLFTKCYCYSTLVSSLTKVNSMFSQISSLYLYMRKEKNIYNLIKEVITKRYNKLKLETSSSIIEKIKEELYHYFPKNDEYVSKVLNMVTLDMSIELNLFDKENIKAKLNEQSKINLEYLRKKINEKYYWSNNQISNINKSHMNFLEKQFFEIIKNSKQSTFLDVIYENSLDVLESQKKADTAELYKIFIKYIDNINKKQSVIDENFQENSKKGTNYVMKEVETVREIEVICDADKDIDTVIEPDF